MAKRILIVDDSAYLRIALRTALEAKLEVTCAEATDGRDAVNRALEINPDVIVLDLSMPVMNGLEAGTLLETTVARSSNRDVHYFQGQRFIGISSKSGHFNRRRQGIT